MSQHRRPEGLPLLPTPSQDLTTSADCPRRCRSAAPNRPPPLPHCLNCSLELKITGALALVCYNSAHLGESMTIRLPLSCLCLAAALQGQETRGMIYGRVLDSQSSAVAGAQVIVTNTDTNAPVHLKSNATGYYEASLLLPGAYQVTVDAPGFRKVVRSGIQLQVSSRVEVDLKLEVGSINETITVTAEAPMLDTSAVSSGRVMDNRT